MDWKNLEPDKYNLMDRHYTPGRGGAQIEFVTLHHMAMIGDVDKCVSVWQDRQASAHYCIDQHGNVGQAVNDWDTAWSNANAWSNSRSISIEHSNSGGPGEDWPISEETREAGAHLVAALCHAYGLGRPQSGVNVRYHSVESGGTTGCPYHLRPGHKYNREYLERAQYWYDRMANPTPPPPPSPTGGTTAVLTFKQFTDFIKGYFGPQIDALQEVWQQLRGPKGNGWPQLGQNAKGQNLTLVDALAALRLDVARLDRKIDELKENR